MGEGDDVQPHFPRHRDDVVLKIGRNDRVRAVLLRREESALVGARAAEGGTPIYFFIFPEGKYVFALKFPFDILRQVVKGNTV